MKYAKDNLLENSKSKVLVKPAVLKVLNQIKAKGFADPLDAPDEIIQEICEEPCLNLKFVGKRLKLNNRGSQVICAHLAVDHVMSTFVSNLFVDGAPLKSERMYLPQKVDWLVSLGELDADRAAWVRRINSLRNKLAHEMTFEVPDEEVRDYIEFFQQFDDKPFMPRKQFAHALIMLVLFIDANRATSLFKDVKWHLAMENVHRVLRKTDGLSRSGKLG